MKTKETSYIDNIPQLLKLHVSRRIIVVLDVQQNLYQVHLSENVVDTRLILIIEKCIDVVAKPYAPEIFIAIVKKDPKLLPISYENGLWKVENFRSDIMKKFAEKNLEKFFTDYIDYASRIYVVDDQGQYTIFGDAYDSNGNYIEDKEFKPLDNINSELARVFCDVWYKQGYLTNNIRDFPDCSSEFFRYVGLVKRISIYNGGNNFVFLLKSDGDLMVTKQYTKFCLPMIDNLKSLQLPEPIKDIYIDDGTNLFLGESGDVYSFKDGSIEKLNFSVLSCNRFLKTKRASN